MLNICVKYPLKIVRKSKESLATRYDEMTGQPYSKTVNIISESYYNHDKEISNNQYYKLVSEFNKHGISVLGNGYLVYSVKTSNGSNDKYYKVDDLIKELHKAKKVFKKFNIQEEPFFDN